MCLLLVRRSQLPHLVLIQGSHFPYLQLMLPTKRSRIPLLLLLLLLLLLRGSCARGGVLQMAIPLRLL